MEEEEGEEEGEGDVLIDYFTSKTCYMRHISELNFHMKNLYMCYLDGMSERLGSDVRRLLCVLASQALLSVYRMFPSLLPCRNIS